MTSTLFAWVLICGVMAKLWRAWMLWQDSGSLDGFAWLPLGLGAEILLAALLTLLATALARLVERRWPDRTPSWTVLAFGLPLALANLVWLGLNHVSFTITQAPITFQRVRGDEGVRFADAHLVTTEALVPAAMLVATALLALPLLATVVVRWRPVIPAGMAFIVVGLATLGYGFDVAVTRTRNFGVADTPVFTLAESFVRTRLAEERKPRVRDKDADLDELLVARTPIAETALPPRQRSAMRNAIVFFAEGIPRKLTSLDGGEDAANASPNLLRRARRDGLELTRHHAPYHKSISAIFSLMCADYPPPDGKNIVEFNPRIDCGEFSDVLAGHGLRTGLFHGGEFGFYDKLALLGMRSWDVQLDARHLSDPARFEENEWGIDDRAVVEAALEWIDSLDPGERFASVLIPITAHWPFWIPSDVAPAYPGISPKNRFLSAVRFSDQSFEMLMQGLEARGLAEETAVIFVADHGETVGERPRASAGTRLAYEPSLHTPGVILAPGMWPAGATTNRLTSHVDLLPTLLDLLGLPADPRHRGRSVLTPDLEPRRMFIGANNGPRWIGFLDGNRKFILNTQNGVREAYDLAADADERHNIVDELSAEQVDALEQDALTFAWVHQRRLEDARQRDDAADVEQRFVEAVDVRVRLDGRGAASGEHESVTVADRMLPCVRVPDNPAGRRLCAGAEPDLFVGRKKGRASGRHDCIFVRAPRLGVLELEIRDQPWLDLVTRVRAAETRPLRDEGNTEVPIEVWVDGVLEGRATLEPNDDARLPFPAPSESLLVRVGGDGPAVGDVCITLTDRAWTRGSRRKASALFHEGDAAAAAADPAPADPTPAALVPAPSHEASPWKAVP